MWVRAFVADKKHDDMAVDSINGRVIVTTQQLPVKSVSRSKIN